MKMIPKNFTEFLVSHEICWAVVSFAPYDRKEIFGDQAKLGPCDILTQYFDDMPTLSEALADRIMPWMVQQGDVSAVVCKPSDHVIVGLLFHDGRDVVQRYWHGRKLNDDLSDIWIKGAK